jgi:hypothetical protein|tara:strand:+ start:315 stop:551 length:237 start_codon:yes stop_codon:yes gene_type:complete
MFKPSITVHKSTSGDLSTIAISEDASVCLQAFYDCTKPGEIAFFRKGTLDKQKKIIQPLISEETPEPKKARKSSKSIL